MRDLLPEVAVSDFCAAEFASAIGSRVRRRALELPLARTAFSEFDAWLLDRPRTIRMVSADLSAAASLMRRLDLPLKTGDAVHLAIAQRAASAIATFDRQMVASAAVLGVEVAGT